MAVGSMPKIIASVVINDRAKCFAGVHERAHAVRALRARPVHEVHDDRFRHEAHEHDDADHAHDVERAENDHRRPPAFTPASEAASRRLDSRQLPNRSGSRSIARPRLDLAAVRSCSIVATRSSFVYGRFCAGAVPRRRLATRLSGIMTGVPDASTLTGRDRQAQQVVLARGTPAPCARTSPCDRPVRLPVAGLLPGEHGAQALPTAPTLSPLRFAASLRSTSTIHLRFVPLRRATAHEPDVASGDRWCVRQRPQRGEVGDRSG